MTIIRPELKTLANIVEIDHGTARAFRSTSEDPQISLLDINGFPLRLKRDEYYLFFEVSNIVGRFGPPSLYVNVGNGFTEGQDARFNAYRISATKWFIHFKSSRNVIDLRLDPTETLCEFSIDDLFIVRAQKLRLINFKRAVSHFVPPRIKKYIAGDEASGDAASKYHFHAVDLIPTFTKSDQIYKLESGREATIENTYKIEYEARLYACQDGRYYHEYAGLATDSAGDLNNDVKAIAFYLPQMHPIPENDAWWGKGFTEWTNVSKAVARFAGHYQPRLPAELGFYDLRAIETLERQVELANTYGLDAFCFYYYWFSGHRLLERPVDQFLAAKDLNLEFCLCWANENWTRRWDGLESDILIAQNHTDEDSAAVFRDWLRYFKDDRYINIDGKPLILIYRPDLIPEFDRTAAMWRDMAIAAGFAGLHILAANAFGNKNISASGLDGLYEFPPHNIQVPHIDEGLAWFDPNHKGHAYSYSDAVNYAKTIYDAANGVEEHVIHPGVLVGWDTEARKPSRGEVMVGSSPSLFRQWLESAYIKSSSSKGEAKFVFINAWNEWAEGAYLEPDRRHGYGYLTALRSVKRQYGLDDSKLKSFCYEYNQRASRPKQKVIILHIFYRDLVDEFARELSRARLECDADLIITMPNLWSLADVQYAIEQLRPRKAFLVENIGRDVFPFITACRNIKEDNYFYACKIHSKKSTHRIDGDRWRNDLINGLLSSEAIAALEEKFFGSVDYTIAAPENAFLPLGNTDLIAGNRIHLDALAQMFGVAPYTHKEFVGGTMFWFAFDTLMPIFDCDLSERDFGHDLGQVDGTLAHAFERIFALVCTRDGSKPYKIETGFNFAV